MVEIDSSIPASSQCEMAAMTAKTCVCVCVCACVCMCVRARVCACVEEEKVLAANAFKKMGEGVYNIESVHWGKIAKEASLAML